MPITPGKSHPDAPPPWNRHARRITIIYAGFASLWILISDRTVFYFLGDYKDIVWVNIIKGLLFVATTSFLLWCLMRRLLTGLERSQTELAEREHQVRTIFHTVNDGIVIIKPVTGEILGANQTACDIFQYDLSTLQTLTITDLGPSEGGQTDAHTAGLIANTKSGERVSTEWRYRRADGSLFWAEVIGMTTLLAGEECFLATIRDITDRRNAEQEIHESRSRLRALLTHLEKAREAERMRISREVHDVLGQLLTGMKMNLNWITHRIPSDSEDNRKILSKLEESDSIANAILSSIQEIAHDLRPGILDRLGLVPALRFEAERFTKRTGMPCQFNTLLDAIRLPEEKSTHVFRVVQEMLTNVARHSQANMVTINLVRSGHQCIISVTDDGIGISDMALRDHGSLGLLGMSERASLLGGKVTVQRTPNKGTTATLTFDETPE